MSGKFGRIKLYSFDGKHTKKYRNLNSWMPQFSNIGSRIISIGTSGSGKTTAVCNALSFYMDFDTLYVYGSTPNQKEYVTLRASLDYKNAKYKQMYGKNARQIKYVFSSNIDDIISVQDLNPEQNNVVIFDDILQWSKDKKFINKITEFFTVSRHSCCICWLLTQYYYTVPKVVRLNCNYFLMYKSASAKDFALLRDENGLTLTKEQFKRAYDKAMNDVDDINAEAPFLLIDTSGHLPRELSIRSRFDKVIRV